MTRDEDFKRVGEGIDCPHCRVKVSGGEYVVTSSYSEYVTVQLRCPLCHKLMFAARFDPTVASVREESQEGMERPIEN